MNKDDQKIVKAFNAKWKYRLDSEQYGMKDAWKIIYSENTNGKYVGDCEDSFVFHTQNINF